MNKEPLITIGIPAYERPVYTRELLESCLSQNYSNYEILIGDDSKSDDIENLVQSLNAPQIHYFRNRPSRGLVGNLNQILHVTKTPWMLIMANDDLLEPDYLSEVQKIIEQDPQAALVRTRYRMIDEEGHVTRIDRKHPFQMDMFEFLSRVFLRQSVTPWMSISAVAYPTQNLKKIGGFRDFHRGHHTDRVAWAELSVFGKSYFIQEPLASIRSHREEITTTMDPEYEKAVKSTSDMFALMKNMLNALETSVMNKKDEENLMAAQENLRQYVSRQISRSFDQGLMGRMENKDLKSFRDLCSIHQRIKETNIPAFFSFYFYTLLLILPFPLRYQILPWFKEYKFRRWHS